MMRRLLQGILITLTFIACTASADPLAEALRAVDAGQHKQGAQMLAPLAEAGNVVAQYRLGVLYYFGKGVKEDEKQAVELWKKAAAQGSAESMFMLGEAFLTGNQTEQMVDDAYREAATWYFQAASNGHAESQYRLGQLFLAGTGVEKNHHEAAYWMKKAADQGHAKAKDALGSINAAKNATKNAAKK